MRYALLAIGGLMMLWGMWVFATDRPGAYRDVGLRVCNSISDDLEAVACSGRVYKSADDISNRAVAGIVGGGLLTAFAGASIGNRRQAMQDN